MEDLRFLPAGDRALVMEFGNKIDPKINAKIRITLMTLDRARLDYVLEIIPTYRSLLIIYNPLKISFDALAEKLKNLVDLEGEECSEARVVEIPVVYGGKYGPDLNFVASHNRLSQGEVIKIHSSKDYLVYMLGFTPGFPYLGGMDERIATPRLAQPRTKIPAGSTGIADFQTGVYPIGSPGGWQLIGRTPVRLYDPQGDSPFLLRAGDYVRFVPIYEDRYLKIKDEVDNGSYQIRIQGKGE